MSSCKESPGGGYLPTFKIGRLLRRAEQPIWLGLRIGLWKRTAEAAAASVDPAAAAVADTSGHTSGPVEDPVDLAEGDQPDLLPFEGRTLRARERDRPVAGNLAAEEAAVLAEEVRFEGRTIRFEQAGQASSSRTSSHGRGQEVAERRVRRPSTVEVEASCWLNEARGREELVRVSEEAGAWLG